jgi:hypothetical protein
MIKKQVRRLCHAAMLPVRFEAQIWIPGP